MWFLNCRTKPSGGDVGPVQVTDGYLTYTDRSRFLADIRGRDLFIGVHGFNVHQAGSVDHLQQWQKLLTLDANGLFLGGLWPGDSVWLGALEYAFAAKSAMRSGSAFADFINRNFAAARSLSFVSHSLGARVALQAIQQLAGSFDVRRLILMAPAVSDDCLTNEFATAARRVREIVLLGSKQDDVLKEAFPLGNPISGIFAQGHPYWHAALGREGPATYPSPNNIQPNWLLPDAWNVGHSDYLPPPSPFTAPYAPTAFASPVTFPLSSGGVPTMPGGYVDANGKPVHWQSGWTAGWASIKFA